MLEQAPGPVGWVGLAWIVFIGAFLPFSVWRAQRRSRATGLVPREKYWTATMVQLVVLAAIGVGVAHVESVELFPAWTFSWTHLAAALGALAIFVGVNWKRWEAKVRARERRVHYVSPHSPRDLAYWSGVCACAGIGEELIYRAVLPTLVWRITESVPAAIAIAVIAFGLAHVHQGASGVVVTAFFAVLAHAVVYFTHTLVIAIALHFAYDLIAGLRYAALSRRFGYTPPDAAV
jgi:hypothetical protein